MTGKQKIESALSPEGTPEVAAVICYDDIFVRDHWNQITDYPWWYKFEPCIDHQIKWQRDYFKKTHLDWFMPDTTYTKQTAENFYIDVRSKGVFLIDKISGFERMLTEPLIGGSCYIYENPADTFEEIDIRMPAIKCVSEPKANEIQDPTYVSLKEFNDLYPISYVGTPLNDVFFMLGFEETMIKLAMHSELIHYSCKRCLDYCIRNVREAAVRGAPGIFIQDCFSDMINPVDFKSYNLSYTIPLVEEIRSLGMKSVLYFCGNPTGKLDLLLDIGADALSLEESKKNFKIDIDDLSEYINGRCTLLGNLDAIGILQNGSDEQLRQEIKRQLTAGKKNKNRFIMSLGSPVTPSTHANRVGLYSDLIHELGVY